MTLRVGVGLEIMQRGCGGKKMIKFNGRALIVAACGFAGAWGTAAVAQSRDELQLRPPETAAADDMQSGVSIPPIGKPGVSRAPGALDAWTKKPATLVGSSIYIYSFLDVREDMFTPKVLGELDQYVENRFSQVSAKSVITHFKDSETGRNFADSLSYGASGAMIPIKDVVFENLNREAEVGARYRLILFPASFDVAGAWRFYRIRWDIVEISTGRRVWSYLYSGKHLVIWSNSENADGRARKIVDAAFNEMHAQGLL